MGKLMYMDETYSSTVENCTGLKYDNASSGLDAENVQDAIDETNSNLSQLSNPNLFINGNFQIWQRGEEFTVAINEDGTYGGYKVTADKWIVGAWGSNVAHVYKSDNGLTFSRETDTPITVFQQLEEETLKGILGKPLTMSYGIKDDTGTYQEYRRNIVLDENIEIEPFIIAEENFCIELQRGYTLIWAKLEVGEFATKCIPEPRDVFICKAEKFGIISSEEVKTGDFYFGKPIYTKTIRYTTNITAGQTNPVPHGINNIDTVWIDMSNSYLTNAAYVFPVSIGYYMSGFDNMCPYVDKTNIYFASQGTWGTNWEKVVTLRYTKTKD